MSKEIDLIKCIISEIDDNLYSDFGGNPCISYTSNLKKLLLALDTPEVRHFFENYNQQDQRIAVLEEQLKNSIRPKFKYGQEVWCVFPTNEHREGFVYEEEFVGYTKDKIICRITENEEFEYDEVFATLEEAKAKLKEMMKK